MIQAGSIHGLNIGSAGRWALAVTGAAITPFSLAADAPPPTLLTGNLATGGYLGQLIGGLAFVVIAILALAWMLRRFSGAVGAAAPRAIEILAVRSIGARERLLLVQVGDEQILIGVSPTGMRTLHHLRKPLDLPRASQAGVDFASLLRKQISKSTDA